MKTRYIFASLLLSGAAVTACVEMETTPEGSTLTDEIKEEVAAADPTKVEAGLNAIYAQFTAWAGALPDDERHNDFGYPALMMMFDSNGHDFVSQVSGYNWFSGGIRYTDRVYTSYESEIVWNTLYKMVNTANNVIGSIDPETDDATLQNHLGQALSARAFDYWVLAQLYQFNYADHKGSPCVPVLTDENADDAAINGLARSTVEETYTQIFKDIDKAIGLLDASPAARTDKRYINAAVAYALRARINLTTENWSAAASDADKAISLAGGESIRPYSIAEVSVPAITDAADPAILWAVVITEEDDVVQTGICNWPSHMGALNWGYCTYMGGHQINKSLFASIPDTDVRKGWWLDEEGYSANLTEDKLDYADYYYGPYTTVKFIPYKGVIDQDVNANDIPLIRIEEMYYIKAEAEAMGGSPATGKATLESFVKAYRDPAYAASGSSAAEIQDAVYQQRRVEFWGEGLNWFDIMRLKKDVDRRGAGYESIYVFHLPYGEANMLWRIPEAEIQSNPLISEEDNNPSGTTPTAVADTE